MSTLAILSLALAAATQPAPQRDAVEIFRQVCIRGEATFAPGTVTKVDFEDLPEVMRHGLEFPGVPAGILLPVAEKEKMKEPAVLTAGQYLKILEVGKKTFLAVEERGETEDPRKGRYCTLATKSVRPFEAAKGLEVRAKIDPEAFKKHRHTIEDIGWSNLSPDGHRLSVSPVTDGYVFLQSVVTGRNEVRRLYETIRPTATPESKAKIDELLNSMKETE